MEVIFLTEKKQMVICVYVC